MSDDPPKTKEVETNESPADITTESASIPPAQPIPNVQATPRKQRDQQVMVMAQSELQVFVPLPPPNWMREYASVDPKIKDLFLEQWTKESEHRRALQNKEDERQTRELAMREKEQTDAARVVDRESQQDHQRRIMGLVLVALFAFALIAALTYTATHGATLAALAFTAIPICGTIAFVLLSRRGLSGKEAGSLPRLPTTESESRGGTAQTSTAPTTSSQS